jgi:hypothetical protein
MRPRKAERGSSLSNPLPGEKRLALFFELFNDDPSMGDESIPKPLLTAE